MSNEYDKESAEKADQTAIDLEFGVSDDEFQYQADEVVLEQGTTEPPQE